MLHIQIHFVNFRITQNNVSFWHFHACLSYYFTFICPSFSQYPTTSPFLLISSLFPNDLCHIFMCIFRYGLIIWEKSYNIHSSLQFNTYMFMFPFPYTADSLMSTHCLALWQWTLFPCHILIHTLVA